MEYISVLDDAGIISDNATGSVVAREKIPQTGIGFNPAFFTLITEGGINFLRYLISLGMSGHSDFSILSSKKDYYYDDNSDLKSVRILIILKKLNMIKHLDMFLNTLIRILPPNANFIGYFSINKSIKKEESQINKLSRSFSRLINIPVPGENHIIDKYDVQELLERNGFKTIDMKEMNGKIYFNSRTVSLPA
jgi:hypothetical protein